jgi:hypothetical protein
MISTLILRKNTNYNMTSFFHFVSKTVVYFFHQLDFLVVKQNGDELDRLLEFVKMNQQRSYS